MEIGFLMVVFTFFIGSLFGSEDSYRTFKDQQGRSIQAKITNVSGQDVYVELPGMGNVKTDISIYSAADQQYIKDWAYRALLLSGIFDVRFTDEVSDKQKSSSKGVMYEKYTNAYGIVINNESYEDVEGITLEYLVLKFEDEIASDKRSAGKQVRKKSKIKLDKLPAQSEARVTTEAFQMVETELEDGYIWKGGGDPKSKDKLDGIWIKLFVDGKQVYEMARPESMMRKEVW